MFLHGGVYEPDPGTFRKAPVRVRWAGANLAPRWVRACHHFHYNLIIVG